ncbi:MAG: hypothetical protein HYR48_08580 [Gemmatimonadetes bacterium]|nr:hypothetical protein [Gemmatimonadota bacterium]
MPAKRHKPKAVREPVMVYLDAPDRDLLQQMVDRTGLPKTELFRRGLRRLADETLTERKPGWSLEYLIANAADDEFPPDLAERHDYYLAAGYEEHLRRKRKKKRARAG